MGRFLLPAVLFLFGVLVAVQADFMKDEFGTDDDTKRIIKEVLSTWKKDKKVTIIDDREASDAVAKQRTKARYRPLEEEWRPPGEFAECSMPGYTGDNCAFPICNVTNNNFPDSQAQFTALDINYELPCNAQFTTHIDGTVTGMVMVEITTNGQQNPSIKLYDSNQVEVPPNNVLPGVAQYQAFFNYLPPGPYIIVPQSDDASVECIIFVNGVTTMSLSAGWVTEADFGEPERYDFPRDQAYRDMANTFVSHVNGLRYPGEQIQITIYQSENECDDRLFSRTLEKYGQVAKLVINHQLSTRYGCGYERYFQSFFCRNTGPYFFVVEGFDFYGYTFRRVQFTQCILNPSAPTELPTTPTPPPGGLKCRNDGVLLNATDGSQFCYCQPLFTGVDCGSILCANGGTPAGSGLFCFCPPGFTGPHCADVTCTPRSGFGFGADRPRLTFVIRSKYTMTDLIQPIIDGITRVVNEYSFDPEYLNRFALVLFNNNEISLTKSYSSLGDMVNDLRTVQLNPSLDGGCADSVLTAISSAVNLISSNKSPIYVFTDALANDNGLEDAIYQRNTYWRSPIYILYVTPSAASGCLTDPFDNGYRAFGRIATRSAGHTFDIPDRTKTGELFYQHARNTLYRMNFVMTNDPAQCGNQPQFQPVMVDTQLYQLAITATGTQMSLNVLDPDGRTINATLEYSQNFTYIWTITNPLSGQWLLNIRSGTPSSACSYRILSINRLNAQTDYDFFWATTPYIILDGAGSSPIYQQATPLVGHINNYRLDDPTKVFAEMTIYANDDMGVRQPIYFSNGIWRDGCDYQLYFGPFTCQRPNQNLYMTVFVRDQVGFMIQRSSMMYCAASNPTLFPPSDCQNGGVQVNDPNNANNTFCLCQPYFTGPLCQGIICANGGSDIGGVCRCGPGHSGRNCEITRCISPGNNTRFGPNDKQIAFVIEMTGLSVGGLSYLNNYISTLIRDFQSQHPRWITTFIVAGYNSTYSAILKTVPADHANSVVDAINEAYNWTVANMDASCTVQLWQTLNMVMTQMSSEGLVFVFHASIPQQGPDVLVPHISNTFDLIGSKKIQMNVFFGLTGSGAYPCNSNITAFRLLFDATGLSRGLVYETTLRNWDSIIRIMPNYYESGIVYENYYPDCSSQAQTFFVPVDSVTQTLQITTFGFGSNQTIQMPNGTVFAGSYDLLRDTVTGMRITEVRRACDPGWDDTFENDCMLYVFTLRTWDQAQQYCAAAGGFLVDSLSANKEAFLEEHSGGLSFWIGLNDIQQEGTFVWDRPNGTQNPPLGPSSYKNWAANNPVNDPQHQINCVVRRRLPTPNDRGMWYNEPCNRTYTFVCQKHKYNQNVTAGVISDNDLPPGIWQVQIQTQPNADEPSVCFVQIRSQSSIQVYPGYVLDQFSDQPNVDPITQTPNNRIIAATTGLEGRNPGYLQYAHFYGRNLTMQKSATYELRNGCNFPYLSQPWPCPVPGTLSAFQVMHVGVDQQGYMFQRLTAGTCLTGRSTCSNGGIAYQGVCICPPYWTGTTCTIPTCINNGTLTADNRTCICPTGYGGHACQIPVCVPQIPQSFSFDGKSLVLVVETTLQSSAFLTRLRGFVPGWLNGIIAQQPNWFSNFILVTFDSTTVKAPIVTTTVNDLSSALNASTVTDFSSNCSQPLFRALATALQSADLVVPGSVVWVITKGNPSDLNQEANAFLAISATRPLVNFLVVDDSYRPCGLDPNSETVAPMIDTAFASGGNSFFLPLLTFTTHLTAYMPTLYQSSLLDVSFNRTCPAGSKWYAQVDTQMTQVVIDTYAYYAQISVTDPQGNPVVTNDLYNSPLNRLVIFPTDPTKAGIYTIAVSSQAATCIVQVRGSSPLQVFFGYTQATTGNGQSQDDSYYSPLIGVNTNLLLAHVTGLSSYRIGGLSHVEMLAPNAGLIVSPMMIRGNCSYEFYSNTFRCPNTAFLVAVHGSDNSGLNFRRYAVAFCALSRPSTTAPPSTTTLPTTVNTGTTITTTIASTGTTTVNTGSTTVNTGSTLPTTTALTNANINLDLVIAIDASATMPQANYLEVIAFLKTVLIPYTIGQGNPGTRVAIINVPGDSGFVIPSNTLASIGSREVLVQALDNADGFYDGSAGQQFNALLTEVISTDFINAGYRADITNHLLLYITGTSTFTDGAAAAQTAAQSIRGAKRYGIITIAYKAASADAAVLQGIAGGADCVLIASTVDMLNQQGFPLIRDKTLTGQYCGMPQ